MSTFRDAARVLRDRMRIPFSAAAQRLAGRERRLAGCSNPDIRSKVRETALAELLDEYSRRRAGPEVIIRRRVG